MSEELILTEEVEKKSKKKTHRKARSKEQNSSFPVVETQEETPVEETTLEVVESKPLVNLSSSKEEIVDRMQETNSIEELKDLTNLFGISLTKKEMLRASKESDLMDKLLEQAEKRIVERGDCMPNADLLDYMKTLQSNVDKSRKTINDDVDKASIKITNTHTEINVNVNDPVSGLSRESREKVLERMKEILNNINQEHDVIIDEPQEVDVKESKEDD